MANVTLKDVAARAGVSVSLASKVITGKMGNSTVSEEKAQKIFTVAKELGYVANMSARRLRTGKGKTIAVVLPYNKNYYNTVTYEFMDGLLQTAMDSDYEFINVFYREEKKELEGLEQIRNLPIDGFIYYQSYFAEGNEDCRRIVESIVRSGVPTIIPGVKFLEVDGCYYFTLEEMSAGYNITKYCIEKGKKRILLMSSYDEKRNKGYMKAMQEHGLPLFTTGPIAFEYNAGYNFFNDEINKWNGNPPEAIFATCDLCAMGVIDAMHEHGLTQDDILVVSVDGLPAVECIYPFKFPTVHQPTFHMGNDAAKAMIKLIETGVCENKVYYQTEILNA